MTKPLFAVPADITGAAAEVQSLFQAGRYQEAIGRAEQALAAVESKLAPRSHTVPDRAAGTPAAEYQALTLLLANAFAAVGEWKAAKEALGKYRVRFPRDPWGFAVGAELTRRDPAVRDREAILRAAELLDGEAERLRAKG